MFIPDTHVLRKRLASIATETTSGSSILRACSFSLTIHDTSTTSDLGYTSMGFYPQGCKAARSDNWSCGAAFFGGNPFLQ